MQKRNRPRSRRYRDYTGDKQWRVHHPKFGAVIVFAPTSQAAIVQAAIVQGQQWTKIDWYSYCTVQPERTAKVKAVI